MGFITEGFAGQFGVLMPKTFNIRRMCVAWFGFVDLIVLIIKKNVAQYFWEFDEK